MTQFYKARLLLHCEILVEDFTLAAAHWFQRTFGPAVARQLSGTSLKSSRVQNRPFDDFAGAYDGKEIIAKGYLFFGKDYWPSVHVVLDAGPQSQYGRMLNDRRAWLMGGHSTAEPGSRTGTVSLVLLVMFTFHTKQGLQRNLKECTLESWRRRRPSDGLNSGVGSQLLPDPELWLQSREVVIKAGHRTEDNDPRSKELSIECFENTLGFTLADLFGELGVPDQLTQHGLDGKSAVSVPLGPLAHSIEDAQIKANEAFNAGGVLRRKNNA